MSMYLLFSLLPLSQYYLDHIKTSPLHKELSSPHRLNTGVSFFTGISWLSLLYHNKLYNDNLLCLYTKFYVLLDHYMDDPTICEEEKNDLIKKLLKVLFEPTIKVENVPEIFLYIIEEYKKIVTTHPHIRLVFVKNFVFEMFCQKYQSKNLTLLNFLEISRLKGAYTSDVVGKMLEIDDEENIKLLGECAQLIDDINDIYEDMEIDIHTVATETFKQFGNIDWLVLYTFQRIEKLSGPLEACKDVLKLVLMYPIQKNPELVSEKMCGKKEMSGMDTEKVWKFVEECLQCYVKK